MKKTKQYKVLISPFFTNMMQQHVAFLASQNEKAAIELKERLIKKINSLATFPERFSLFENHRLPITYRKMYVPNWFLVIYEIEDDTVLVEYVIDCRRENSWLLGENDIVEE